MTNVIQLPLFGSAPEPTKERPRWSVVDPWEDDDCDEPAEGFDHYGNLTGSIQWAYDAHLQSYFTIDAAAREYAEDSYGLVDNETDTYYPPAECRG